MDLLILQFVELLEFFVASDQSILTLLASLKLLFWKRLNIGYLIFRSVLIKRSRMIRLIFDETEKFLIIF